MTQLHNDTARHRYELTIDGQVCFVDYQEQAGTVLLMHVEVPPALRGSGAASTLMQAVMDEIGEQKRKAKPICSYAAVWLQRHRDYHALVA